MTARRCRRLVVGLALVALPLPGSARETVPEAGVTPFEATDAILVTPGWLAHHLNDPQLVLLEVGEGSDYDRGHIAGARPVDVMAFHAHGVGMPDPGSLASSFASLGLSDSSRVVVYGDRLSASMIFLALDYLGYGSHTAVLDGGKAAWVSAGQSLSRAVNRSSAGRLTPHPRPAMVVTSAWLVAHLADSSLALVDARSWSEYAGEPDHMSGGRPGHIPGARNLDWEDTFDSTGHLRPAEELRGLFRSAGYEPGDQLVVYCTVGMRASHLYFVARYLGYDPRIYVGSMNDWASDPARPVNSSSRP